MPSFTQRISNLQQVGPVIEVILTPSIAFLQAMKISPSATKAIKVLAMIDTEAPLKGQHIQCLVGRDVLQHGVFIYTGYDNSFTLSF